MHAQLTTTRHDDDDRGDACDVHDMTLMMTVTLLVTTVMTVLMLMILLPMLVIMR